MFGEEFSRANATMTVGWSVFSDQVGIAVGKFDDTTKASRELADTLMDLARFVNETVHPAVEGLAAQMDRILVYAVTGASLIGVRLVAGVLTLARAFAVLRLAIIATGFGLLVVAVGEFYILLEDLAKAAGGWSKLWITLAQTAGT